MAMRHSRWRRIDYVTLPLAWLGGGMRRGYRWTFFRVRRLGALACCASSATSQDRQPETPDAARMGREHVGVTDGQTVQGSECGSTVT